MESKIKITASSEKSGNIITVFRSEKEAPRSRELLKQSGYRIIKIEKIN